MATRLDPNKPIETRCGYQVKIYEVQYEKYYNYAYLDEDTDIWWPKQANWDGSETGGEKALDLRNVT